MGLNMKFHEKKNIISDDIQWGKKVFVHCRFFKVSHLQRMERSVIFIVGTPQL